MMLETLESRRMLSVNIDGNTLIVEGTSANDSILVEQLSPFSFFIFQNGSGAVHTTSNPILNIELRGLAGNDTLALGPSVGIFGLTHSKLVGGANDDTLVPAAVGSRDVLDGGDGCDTADYRFRCDNLNLSLNNIPDDGNFAFGEQDNIYDTVENILAGKGSDLLFGSSLKNYLDGGRGNDVIYGAEGNDVLVGGLGNDSMRGGDGDDVLDGGAGIDSMFGDNDNDWIYAWDGVTDIIAGGAGNDTAVLDDFDNFGSSIENPILV